MNARVQEYEQQTSNSPVGMAQMDPGKAAAVAGSAYNPEALAKTSEAFGQAAVAFKKADDATAVAWSAKQLSAARLQWTQHFLDKQASTEPGAPGFTPGILKDYDEYAAKTLETAPSDSAKVYLGKRLQEFRTTLGESAMQFEAKARIDYRSDMYVDGIANTQKLMNTDPGQYKIALTEQLATIDAASLPPVQKSILRQKAIDGISEAATWSQIQRSPSGFLSSIGFTKPDEMGKIRKSADTLMGVTGNEAFDALPYAKRTQMFEGAVRLKAQLDNDEAVATKKKFDALGDEAEKEGWSRLASGKLTRAYIEEVRPVLKPSEYHALLTGLKGEGKGQKTDPATYRQIQSLIYTDPPAAEKLAFQAHKNGLLSNEHLSSSLSTARTIDRAEGPKSEYEMSRKYIVGQLDPGPMVPDPVARSRLADATDTFDRWVQSGKRTDKEIQERGREIVDQYKFVDLSQTVMALPSPRSGNIRRNAQDRQGMTQDILTAGNKAKKDFDLGRLTKDEYDSEMGILNRWRKAAIGGNK